MIIREATERDYNAVWNVFEAVIQQGETYAYEVVSQTDLSSLWFAPGMKTYVAVESNQVLGTYILKPNQPGRGNHIANASYLVKAASRGKGIGDTLCKHSIQTARELGYEGIQFNLVVSSNTAAVALWERNGFQILGTIPRGFRHKKLGLIDAHIMYLDLSS